MRKENVVEQLLRHEQEQWFKNNPRMIEDARKLCFDAVMFNTKWGFPLKIIIDDEATAIQASRQSNEPIL